MPYFVSFQKHYEACEMIPMKCSNEKCEEIIPRNEVNSKNVSNDCVLRQISKPHFYKQENLKIFLNSFIYQLYYQIFLSKSFVTDIRTH